jgi:hypothetical protein
MALTLISQQFGKAILLEKRIINAEAVALIFSGVGVMIIWGQLSSLPPVFSF